MPIYEYQCPKCGVFEVTQRITESPLKKCPTCKSKIERILSRSSFVLKGSGWYATDYGKKPTASAPTNGDSASTTESSSKSETKSESKSDSKTKSDSSTKSESAPKASSSTAKAAD